MAAPSPIVVEGLNHAYGKGELRKRTLESEAAELARKRFENREARLSRLKQERAEKMARRKQLLKDKAMQQDRIRASIERAEKKGRKKSPTQNTGTPDDT
mgnify:CR=1 FL=1